MKLQTSALTAATVMLYLNNTPVLSAVTAQPDVKPTTIVGCLVHGLPNGTSDRTTAATGATADYFVRTPTVKVPPGTTVAVGSPGAASTATSIGTPAGDSFYRIAGLSADQLRPHVGQRVEIQGRLTDNIPAIETPRATTTQDKDGRARTTVESRIEVAGVLQATAIKMLGTSCEK